MKINTLAGVLSCFLLTSAQAVSLTPANVITSPATVAVSNPKINLNTADVSVLSRSIKGIGLKRAQAIVKYREEHGLFKSIIDLAEVPGLGKNFVNSHQGDLEKTFAVQ